MKFLVDYKDDKYSLAHTLTPQCWAELQSNGPQRDDFNIRYMRFDTEYKFIFTSSIYLTYYGESNGYYTNVHVGIKDREGTTEYYVHFDSRKPLCESVPHNQVLAFVHFMNCLNQFDSAKDASEVMSVENVFNYTDPDKLRNKIEVISDILRRYSNKRNFMLRERMIDWLSKAIMKFGYIVTENHQVNVKFPIAFSVLNANGYTISKV